jgi:ribose 5-phosphate isomerase B
MSKKIAKKIVIASDHAGFELKEFLISTLSNSHKITDLGTNSDESVDYPDFGKKAADEVAKGDSIGIIICGSGIGISIAANRNPKIRAALCLSTTMAQLARQHNDANILALGARLVGNIEALNIVTEFLNTEFEGGRHQKRIDKLSQ